MQTEDVNSPPARPERPVVWAYLDYRRFLQAYYEHRKGLSPSYSYRRLARAAGIRSHSYVKMVMTGERNLSGKSARKLGEACDLSRKELAYFLALVNWNQTKGAELKERCWDVVLGLRQEVSAHVLEGPQVEIFANWKAVAVMEMIRLRDFVNDPAWIARRFRGELSEAEAMSLLERLRDLGLITDTNGSISVVQSTMYKGGDIPNDTIRMFHVQMARAGIEALTDVDVSLREYASSTLTIRLRDLERFKEEVRRFQHRILGLVDDVCDGDAVYQLNVQFFPLTTDAEEEP